MRVTTRKENDMIIRKAKVLVKKLSNAKHDALKQSNQSAQRAALVFARGDQDAYEVKYSAWRYSHDKGFAAGLEAAQIMVNKYLEEEES
jgi:hypothetical protein